MDGRLPWVSGLLVGGRFSQSTVVTWHRQEIILLNYSSILLHCVVARHGRPGNNVSSNQPTPAAIKQGRHIDAKVDFGESGQGLVPDFSSAVRHSSPEMNLAKI